MDRPQQPPEGLEQPANRAVLAYLGKRSCHSDTGGELVKAARSVGLGVYCPDPARYGYVLAHLDGRVVAFAEGMQGFCALVPEATRAHWQTQGAGALPELPGWLFFPLFRPPHFERQLATLLQDAAGGSF